MALLWILCIAVAPFCMGLSLLVPIIVMIMKSREYDEYDDE